MMDYKYFVLALGLFALQSCHKFSPKETLTQFLDRKFEETLQRNPEFASSLGIKYGYGTWTPRNQAYSDHELAEMKATLDTLKMYDADKFSEQDKLSVQLFEQEVKMREEGKKWEHYAYELTQMGGVVTDLPAFLVNVHTVDSVSDAKAYISRLQSMDIPFNETISNLRTSKDKGIVPPAFTFPYVKESIADFEKQLANPEENTLISDFKTKVNKLQIPDNEKKTLISEAQKAISEKVLPAYKEMGVYWAELAKSADTSEGAWSLPNGGEYYKYCLKYNTTTDYTPDQIFELGQKEVARIQGEMRQIMKQVNYKNDSLQDFFNFVRTDARFKYPNSDVGRKELLADANRYIDSTKARYGMMFKVFPKAPIVVMAVEKFREKSVAGAFYENPTLDGKRPGRYYVSLYNMADEPKYQMEALTAHEGIPGHHMQIAIAQELDGIPKFRKHGFYNAYVEGWALYAELLNKEMGFYTDPYSDFGRLSMEIFRAARLVVDVGIHQKGWTRAQAIDYFMKNTANAEGDVRHEIERYFIWPGQATGYKIGMLKILELRERAKTQKGNKFDIKEFHNVVLKNGAVPLSILDDLVSKM